MFAILLYTEDIGVTRLTGLVAGVGNWPGRRFWYGIAAKVAVLSKTMRNKKTANAQHQQEPDYKNKGQAEKVFCVLRWFHAHA